MSPFMSQHCIRCGKPMGRNSFSSPFPVCSDCASYYLNKARRHSDEGVGNVHTPSKPVCAGVCTWCCCTFDEHGRRLECLTEEEALHRTSRGICKTCRLVLLKAVAAREKTRNERISSFKSDAYSESGFQEF